MKPLPRTLQQRPILIDSDSDDRQGVRRSSKGTSEETDKGNPTASHETTSPNKNARHASARLAKQSKMSTIPKHMGRRVPPEANRPERKSKHEEVEDRGVTDQVMTHEATKIALQFADTPVIWRNKEMRKGNDESRRSSLSIRGRRASSLIDSGTSSALPHDQVKTFRNHESCDNSSCGAAGEPWEKSRYCGTVRLVF